jgi:hypothetical protein
LECWLLQKFVQCCQDDISVLPRNLLNTKYQDATRLIPIVVLILQRIALSSGYEWIGGSVADRY